ncbi:MAG TPA: ATP-binding cassette domain-containing protein [Thiothrix sp.]|nr:ATP-binding cassette domain-containing protein [Thiothrix sp.]
MSQEMQVLAKDLHRHYGQYYAVAGVNITLRKGEVLGLLGPNGAGKSTTMKMLTGNLTPDQGEISINGIDLFNEPQVAKKHIGYLPERLPVYCDMTVLEFLRYCAQLRGIARTAQHASIDRALQRCGLGDVSKRLIGNLSKGYQQRVGIAQAILHNPAVIILDEPTVGLDPVQIQEIRHLIRELGEEHSVMLSTHILPEVQALCDRVQIIYQGQTVFEDFLQGLEQRHADCILRLGFEEPIDVKKLQAIESINKIESLGSMRYNVYVEGYQHMGDHLCKLAFAEGWKLTEMTPQTTDLETIFLDLVHREEARA